MDKHIYDIQVRVLVSQEDGEFVARALEMDLLGYGSKEQEAIEELKRAIESQVSFAHQMNDPSLIAFKSGGEYFKRWDDAQRESLRGIISGDKPRKLFGRAVVIGFSKADLESLFARKRFSKSALACA